MRRTLEPRPPRVCIPSGPAPPAPSPCAVRPPAQPAQPMAGRHPVGCQPLEPGAHITHQTMKRREFRLPRHALIQESTCSTPTSQLAACPRRSTCCSRQEVGQHCPAAVACAAFNRISGLRLLPGKVWIKNGRGEQNSHCTGDPKPWPPARLLLRVCRLEPTLPAALLAGAAASSSGVGADGAATPPLCLPPPGVNDSCRTPWVKASMPSLKAWAAPAAALRQRCTAAAAAPPPRLCRALS